MTERTDWSKIKIWGNTFVSNFSSIDCTHGDFAEYTPGQLGEPGQLLAGFGPNYHSVVLDHYEDGEAFIRINKKVYKVKPGLRVLEKCPLSYAWSEIEVYVEPSEKDLK